MPSAPRRLALIACLAAPLPAAAAGVWLEAERPATSTLPSGHPFAPQTDAERGLLSGGDWLTAAGTAGPTPPRVTYPLTGDGEGPCRVWIRKFWRHGPARWRLDDGPWQTVGADAALIERAPLREHVEASWVFGGIADLKTREHTLTVELLAAEGEDYVVGLDCFWFTPTATIPRGKRGRNTAPPDAEPGWFVHDPLATGTTPPLLDLRHLNEEVAGQNGPLQRDRDTLTLADGTPVRFWGVNAPPDVWALPDPLQRDLVRGLAQRGTNLVRLHGALGDTSDPALPVDTARLAHAHRLVANLKAEGIYANVSWYFPLWLKEGGADPEPFGKLFYDEATQERYLDLMRAAFGAVNPQTGLALAHDPAVGFIELCNEDSLFFWTFNPERLPPGDHAALEFRFGGPLLSPWHLTREGLATLNAADRGRAAKQARFYAELQRDFYARAAAVLRDELGFRGLIVAGNWHTADPGVTDVFERWSYTAGDVIDHHGYFEPTHEGETAAYRVEPGQSFADRPATRNPGALPLRPVGVRGFPQMISEFGWPQPNRFRGDAAVLSATTAARQGVDALTWFCLNPGLLPGGLDPGVTKFGLGTPVMTGAFPAAALMFRRGDVYPRGSLLRGAFPGGPPASLDQTGPAGPAALDRLRGAAESAATRSTVGYMGAVNYDFISPPGMLICGTGLGLPDWDAGTGLARSATARSLTATGFLAQSSPIAVGDAEVVSRNHHGSVAVVALDDAPLTEARRILIQAVTEDRPTGWRTRGGVIESLGTLPWRVRDIDASVTLPWTGPPPSRVVALDGSGVAAPSDEAWSLDGGRLHVTLPRDRLYTLIER